MNSNGSPGGRAWGLGVGAGVTSGARGRESGAPKPGRLSRRAIAGVYSGPRSGLGSRHDSRHWAIAAVRVLEHSPFSEARFARLPASAYLEEQQGKFEGRGPNQKAWPGSQPARASELFARLCGVNASPQGILVFE